MASPRSKLEGRRFHMLTVIAWAEWRPYIGGRESAWHCRCDCGKQTITPQKNLVSGKTKSCGCIIGQHKRTHGATVGGKSSPEFMAWVAMHQRCENPKVKAYKDYGGRGIRVCERWGAFENFIADMGQRPSPSHSIDRRDNDGNYEPSNCRWATRVIQSNNRRSSRTLTNNGETLTYAQWETRVGLKPGTICQRIRYRWPEDRLLLPPRAYRRGRRAGQSLGALQ